MDLEQAMRTPAPGRKVAGSYQWLYALSYSGTVVTWECSRAGHRFEQGFRDGDAGEAH